MAFDIDSVTFTDEYTGTGATGTSFLMGNLGDKMTAVITGSVHWEILQANVKYDSTAKTITLQGFVTPMSRLAQNVSWINAGFRAGDTFTIVGGTNAGNFTISSVTDTVIVTVEALTTATETGIDFHGTTTIAYLDFYFNLVANSDPVNYKSLTDSANTQKHTNLAALVSGAGSQTLSPITTSQGWVTGTASASYTSVASYKQNFTITHTFFITPYFLNNQRSLYESQDEGQVDDFPVYYEDTDCLKYICQVDAKFTTRDPVIPHSSVKKTGKWFVNNNPSGVVAVPDFPLGNTGWLNEFLNGGTPDYTLLGITYVDPSVPEVLTDYDINKTVTVTIFLHSTAGSFVNKGATLGSPIVLNFAYCPLDDSRYINTSTTLEQNFIHDRVFLNIGEAPINGENYGTDYQMITAAEAVYVNANRVQVDFTLDSAAAVKTFLKSVDANNRNYMIWCAPQKAANVVTKLVDTDRNNVLCDFQNAAYDQDDATLMTISGDVQFYSYPDTTTNAYTDYKGQIKDGVLSKCYFQMKKGALLKDLSIYIMCYEVADTTNVFPLETFSFNLANSYGKDNEIPDAINTLRDFKLSATDPRNQISLSRYHPLDDATHFGYEILYGFKLRYEAWRFLQEFDPQFVQNPSEQWDLYSTSLSTFRVWHLIVWNGTDGLATDYTTTYNHTSDLTIYDDSHSDDGLGMGGTIATTVDTYTFQGAMYVDAHGFIASDINTHVVASFVGDFSAFPAGITGYAGILYLDIEDQGGYTFVDQSSSEEALVSGSIWATAATLTKVNNGLITLEADINYQNLDPKVIRYIIYARLIYKA